jgi:hypothetical protein
MAEGGEGGKVRLVIDASVAAKWIIPGEPWDGKARALKEAIAKGNVEAYAPTLILYELTSVIFKAVRNGVLTDLLPALKGEGSLRTDHRFAVYRLHPHYLTAGGSYPPRSVRPAVDRGLGLQPITPIPHQDFPSSPGSLGLGDM